MLNICAHFCIVFILFCSLCNLASATPNCKNIVMDIIMKQCSGFGGRHKRGLEKFDETLTKFEKLKSSYGPDFEVDLVTTELPRPLKKRQLSPGQVASIAMPIVTEAVHGVVKASGYSHPNDHGLNILRGPSTFGHILPSRNLPSQNLASLNLPGIPKFLRPSQYIQSPFKFPEPIDEAFDLEEDELDDIYNQIYARSPRGASKEEAMKRFLTTAAKCCQNRDLCLKDTRLIHCP